MKQDKATHRAPASGTAGQRETKFLYFCIHTTFENNTDISNKKV